MSPSPELTAQQQQILVLLAQGKSINAAAAAANIHRNTIANWRRSSASFRNQWHIMQYEQAMYWRDELQSMAQIAVDAILKTLTDEKTPPSVRLRAALAVLGKVTSVAPAQPGLNLSTNKSTDKGIEIPVMHNNAQSAPPAEPVAEPLEVNNVAPEPVIAESVIEDSFEVILPEDFDLHAPASAQSCTSDLDDLLEAMRHLDDDGIADLLDSVTAPPAAPVPQPPVPEPAVHNSAAHNLHNFAQATSPGGNRSGSSRPGSRDSS